MQSSKQQPVIDEELKQILAVECNTILKQALDIEPIHASNLTFTKIEKLLNDATQFEAKLNTLQKELKDSSDTDAQFKLKHIEAKKITVTSCMIILKFKLATKHLEQGKVPSHPARKKPMHDACILANEGYDLALSIQDVYPKEELSQQKELRDKVLAIYEEEYGDSEISKLLQAASRIKNKEEAEKKYQEALKLTTKPEIRYDILIKYSNANLSSINFNQHTVYTSSREAFESYFQVTKKAYTPLVSVIQIILSVPSLSNKMTSNLDRIFMNLYGIIREAIRRCQSKLFENDLTRKKAFLDDVTGYVDLTNKLIKKVNKSDDEWEKMNKQFMAEYGNLIQEIIKKSAEEKKQKVQNETSRQAMNAYLETFDNMIMQFESDHKRKSVSRTPKKAGNVVDDVVHDADSDDDNTMTEVNLEKNPQPMKFKINLDEQLKLLEQAEKDGDLIQKFKINVLIAEYYRIQAQRLRAVSEIISARIYITTADRMIDQIKENAKLTSNISEFEIGISIVLENITVLFDQFILREQQIKKNRESNHEQAKSYVIHTYGRDAWYRNDIEAMKRYALIVKEYEMKLKTLESNWNEMQKLSAKYVHVLSQYRFPIQAQEVTQTNMNYLPISSTSTTTQSNTDPVPEKKIKSTLARSTSSHSFFSQEEVNQRNAKKHVFANEQKFDFDRFSQCTQVLYDSFTAKRRH